MKLTVTALNTLLAKHNGNKAAVARELGISRAKVWRFLCKQQETTEKVATKEVTRQEAQIKHLKLQNQRLNRKLESVNEERRRMEALLECKDATKWTTPISIKSQLHRGRSQATAIIGCTDWHCEGAVDPDIVGDQNEFNLDIATRRIRRTWQKAVYMINFAREISNIKDIVLWLGGDLINGIIHEELEEKNFLGPTEAVLFMQEHVESGIQYLKQNADVERIVVVTNHGNHGRSTARKRISTAYRHSWEWLAFNNLARFFQGDSKVEFRIAKGYHNRQIIQGRRVRFHHGDAIRYGGGIGGITIPVRKAIAQWNRSWPADLDIFGHFHQFHRDWDFISCGCLIGYDGYALEIKADYQPPTQLFAVIDQEYGVVLADPIFCEKDVDVKS